MLDDDMTSIQLLRTIFLSSFFNLFEFEISFFFLLVLCLAPIMLFFTSLFNDVHSFAE